MEQPCVFCVVENDVLSTAGYVIKAVYVSTVTKVRTRLLGFRIPAEARTFDLFLQVQTDFKGHPACYPVYTRSVSRELSFRGVRLITRLLLVPRLRTGGFITPLPFYIFMENLGTHFAFMFSYKNYRL